eukprot:PITA_19535
MLPKLSVKDCIIPRILDCKIAPEIWKTLKDLYEVKNTNRLLFLKREIISIKMEKNETCVAFISRIKELKNKLGDMSEVVSDIDLVTITMNGFSDSNWVGIVNDTQSIIGYPFSIRSGVITWSSKRQNPVSLSSAEAEYQAMCATTCEAVWLRRLLLDAGEEQKVATMIKCDNQSSIKLANNPMFHNNTKHIDTQFHFFREKV